MRTINTSPDIFVPTLLEASRDIGLCLLDSCGNAHPNSHLLVAGLLPVETQQFSSPKAPETSCLIDKFLTGHRVAIFSLSYEFGCKLLGIETTKTECVYEPDLCISLFDALLVHNYSTGVTVLTGNPDRFDEIERLIERRPALDSQLEGSAISLHSNFTKSKYLEAIETIKEQIRRGNTYQTNLTQQLTVGIPKNFDISNVFLKTRQYHPGPFAAFLERKDSTVVSASPERFFRVEGNRILASPIKGTRRRGKNEREDERLRTELLQSEKDRAENTMIVDLLRNDLGRVCEFGSVRVRKLYALQELATLFHLESTIEGSLGSDVQPSQIIEALFPCGSITGAPKLRTMQIIDELETVPRGLSMGAIGIYVPNEGFALPPMLDLSVAIRTMVARDRITTFNVGGGIVIDSEPEKEYEESWAKASALLRAMDIDDQNALSK